MNDPAAAAAIWRRLAQWLCAAAPVLALVAAANLIAVRHCGRETTLYEADHVAYWSLTRSLAESAARSPWGAVAEISASVNRELNLLPSLPLAPFVGLGHGTRLAYLLAVIDVYALAALLLLAAVVARLAGERRPAWIGGWGVAAAVLLLPAWWQPVALGYLDVGGVAIAALVLLAWWAAGSGRGSLVPWLAMGFSLALLAIFRRWWAFWSVTWCAVVALEALWLLVTLRPWTWGGARRVLRGPAFAAAAAVATLLLVAPARVATIAGTDWVDTLAAYKRHAGIAGELGEMGSRWGLLPLALLAAAVVVGLRSRPTRRPVAMLAVQGVLIFALFRRLQDPSPQHWYLYLPGLTVLLGLLLVQVAAALRRPIPRAVWIAAATLAGLAVSATVLSDRPGDGPWGRLTPGFRIRPAVRHDLDEVRRLLAHLDQRLAVAPGWVYVLAVRGPLTDTGLGFANLSLGTEFTSPGFVLSSAHVDRRDGFPDNLLQARYIVLPEPIQAPEPPVHARVAAEPARCLLDGEGIGRAFRRGREVFVFDGGVRASIWDLVRPLTADDVAVLSARLRAYYPDRPDIWQPPTPGQPPGS
ncbi:MAG: hypothetical protein C3F15_08220 [Holophagae bacterium]|nr:MAG: hypothetical protein C3F15_08220 [Holophagae bacterium]